ncbi:unnamed protein product, partial [Mesorhabditis spiculigera]
MLLLLPLLIINVAHGLSSAPPMAPAQPAAPAESSAPSAAPSIPPSSTAPPIAADGVNASASSPQVVTPEPTAAACLEKDYSCLFPPPTSDIDRKECDCTMKSYCPFNKIFQETFNSSMSGHFTQCDINPVQCPADATTANKKTVDCLPGKGPYRYPINDDALPALASVCTRDMGPSTLKETDFYDLLLTCALPRCEQRLKLPQSVISGDAKRFKWCAPPVVRGSLVQYCEPHQWRESIYSPGDSLKPHYVVPSGPGVKPCALLPLCDKDGKVDKSKYMVPMNKQFQWDDTLCEKPCPPGTSLDVYLGANACLAVPPCETLDDNSTGVPEWADRDRKLGYCWPWCSDADSLIRGNASMRTVYECVPRPKCGDDGRPAPRTNRWRSDRCVTVNVCKMDERPETHYCTRRTTYMERDFGSMSHNGAVTRVLQYSLPWIILAAAMAALAFYFSIKYQDKLKDDQLRKELEAKGWDWHDYLRIRREIRTEISYGNKDAGSAPGVQKAYATACRNAKARLQRQQCRAQAQAAAGGEVHTVASCEYSRIDPLFDDFLAEMPPEEESAKFAALEKELGAYGWVKFSLELAEAAYEQFLACSPPSRIALIKRALRAVERSYELHPDDVDVLKQCAKLSGTLAELGSMIEKPVLAHNFLSYLNSALSHTPNDHVLLHMKGRFLHRLTTLNFMERKLTASLGELPEASMELALTELLKAHEKEPTAIDNLLLIAKCYRELGDREKACDFLQQISEVEPNDGADEMYAEEAAEMLKTIS